LERVGLRGRENTALRKFSKGMVQRLGLAQAIQHSPDLVILDEPMSGLDPVGRRNVRDLILELKAEGRSVFFSSHILQDAEMICDRVAILDHGRLRSEGRLQDLVTGAVRWFEISIRGPVPGSIDAECLSHSGDDRLLRVADVDALARVLGAVRESGAQVLSVWPRKDTLEDLFMREIGGDVGTPGAPT
jgi:ABC-2 type transport system ATP-binding protein